MTRGHKAKVVTPSVAWSREAQKREGSSTFKPALELFELFVNSAQAGETSERLDGVHSVSGRLNPRNSMFGGLRCAHLWRPNLFMHLVTSVLNARGI